MDIAILLADGVEDSEFIYPYYRCLESGMAVTVFAPKVGEYTGKHGYTFKADKSLANLSASRFDALILPGGKAPETLRQSKKVLQATRTLMDANKPIAAICHGPQILISAGVLQGRKATCWGGIRDDLQAAGATYVDDEVVVDGKLITSRCPDDLPAFCRELFKALEGSP